MALVGRWSVCLSGPWQQGLHASDVSDARVCLSYYWHRVVPRLPAVLSDCPGFVSPTSSPLCCWRCSFFFFYWVTLKPEMRVLPGIIKALWCNENDAVCISFLRPWGHMAGCSSVTLPVLPVWTIKQWVWQRKLGEGETRQGLSQRWAKEQAALCKL